MNQTQVTKNAPIDVVDARKSYVNPELKSLGDVRDLTLGGSDGTGDSGDPGNRQF